MPKYDYRCLKDTCKTVFVEFVPYYEYKKVRCPICRTSRVERVIKIAPPVKYVGEGFTKKVEQ